MVSWNSKFNITVAFFELTFRYVWPVARMRRNTWTKNKQPFLPLLHDHSPGSRKHPNRVSSIGLRLFYWLGKERIKCLLGGFIFHPSVAIFIACHCHCLIKNRDFFLFAATSHASAPSTDTLQDRQGSKRETQCDIFSASFIFTAILRASVERARVDGPGP